MDVVVLKTYDESITARNNTCSGACLRQPAVGREVGDSDRRRWLGSAGVGLGHGRR